MLLFGESHYINGSSPSLPQAASLTTESTNNHHVCCLRSLYVRVHNANFGKVTFEEGLKGRAVSGGNLATFLRDVATFRASVACYFHWKRHGNIVLGLSAG